LLNATVGVQRAIARLRPGLGRRPSALPLKRRSVSMARKIRVGTSSRRSWLSSFGSWLPSRALLSSGRPRLSGDRLVSFTAVALVAIALAVSNLSTDPTNGPTGNTDGAGTGARIAAAGAVSGLDFSGQGAIDYGAASSSSADSGAGGPGPDAAGLTTDSAAAIDGPFRDDGTLLKPFAVDTSVADGSGLLKTYRVRSGDTLVGIAHHFGVSMMTIWWANHLTNKDTLRIGETLKIPPVNGVVITVASSDTLDSLAARYHVSPSDILDVNQLADPNLVVGQTLTIPGARSAGIPVPKPAPQAPRPTTHPSSTPTTHVTRPPTRYTGGRFLWPVGGGGGYISQYFHYGHYAIDIAADYGTKVMAAASGTVIFAGWKDNGGGYQVWISHGSNLYTTYNHMSAITVGRGQSVSRGQQVGRIGMTGNATGPHLHFEVWIGPVWDGGVRVNPLLYL